MSSITKQYLMEKLKKEREEEQEKKAKSKKEQAGRKLINEDSTLSSFGFEDDYNK